MHSFSHRVHFAEHGHNEHLKEPPQRAASVRCCPIQRQDVLGIGYW